MHNRPGFFLLRPYGERMTKLMDEAIESLRHKVPPELQDDVARAVMELVGTDQAAYELTPEEEAELAESEAEADRGEFATDEQVRAIWAKHGL